jgi:glutathione S-transferase
MQIDQATVFWICGAWLFGVLSTSVLVFLLQRHGTREIRLLADLLARQEERQRCLSWLRRMAWTPMPIEVRERYFEVVEGVHAGGDPPQAA